MKRKTITAVAVLAAWSMLGISCGNTSRQQVGTEKGVEVTQTQGMEVDSLLANAEALVGKSVCVEAVCTHICKHGGRKIFLMGSDDTQTIRVEGGSVGKFDSGCVNALVSVTGILKEERVDEAYLLKWEEQLKATAAEAHGDGEAGCSTEKKARGETANTSEDRIADFRKKIAERKTRTGKDYLSFYYIEATAYEIK